MRSRSGNRARDAARSHGRGLRSAVESHRRLEELRSENERLRREQEWLRAENRALRTEGERLRSERRRLRRARDERLQQWQLFDILLSSLQDFVYLLDASGRFLYANQALLDLWGIDLPDAAGKTFEELGYPPDLVELHARQLEQVTSARMALQGENAYTGPDGRTGYYEYIFVPVIGPDDRVDAVAGVTRDITERKRSEVERESLLRRARGARDEARRRAREERALREAAAAVSERWTTEEIIRSIAENAIVATSADGAYVERIDLAHGEILVAASTGDLVPDAGERSAYENSFAARVIERGDPENVDDLTAVDVQLAGGIHEACHGCAAVVIPLIDAGEAIGALTLVRSPERAPFRADEVERAQTFADLATLAFRRVHLLEDSERRRREFEEVSESRARLMRGFSHDVKNPLGAADGHLALLEDGMLDDPARMRESVRLSRRAVRTALRLIEDLVDLARAEAGEIDIDWSPVDLRLPVREVGEEYRPQAEGKGLRLEIDLPDEFGVIESDDDRVRQIIGNLLSNAVKYTEEGFIRVRVRLREDGGAPGPGSWAAVTVRDTGPGISEEQAGDLFREFTRLHEGSTAPGAGIGLAMSQRVAHALGGRITLESTPDAGSAFTLWLPRERDSGRPRTAAPRADVPGRRLPET